MRATTRFVIGLAAYVVLLLGSIWVLGMESMDGSRWRPAVALLPVPAAGFLLASFVRQVGSLDELMRRIHLEALAVAFAGTLLTVFPWGFLEGVGVDPLSGFVVFGILMALYLLGLLWAHRRYS
jgi:hypothetical protein